MNIYAEEKLLELKRERLANQLFAEPEATRHRPLFGALAAAAGRTLRRTGEGLESWATPALAECEKPMARRTAR